MTIGILENNSPTVVLTNSLAQRGRTGYIRSKNMAGIFPAPCSAEGQPIFQKKGAIFSINRSNVAPKVRPINILGKAMKKVDGIYTIRNFVGSTFNIIALNYTFAKRIFGSLNSIGPTCN